MANLAKIPLSAFDPRLRALLERGCREYVEVPCENPRKAHQLRNTLTMLRARWRNEHKDETHLWEPLYGTIVSSKAGNPTIVTLRPRSTEHARALDPLNLGEPSTSIPLEFDPLANFPAEVENKNDEPDQKT